MLKPTGLFFRFTHPPSHVRGRYWTYYVVSRPSTASGIMDLRRGEDSPDIHNRFVLGPNSVAASRLEPSHQLNLKQASQAAGPRQYNLYTQYPPESLENMEAPFRR